MLTPRSATTVGADSTAAAVAAILDEDGCVVVADLAAPETMDRITAELEPYLVATDRGSSEFLGQATRRTGALIARSPGVRPLVTTSLILDVMDLVLGNHASTYQVDLTQLVDIGPGESGQRIHRDQWSFDGFPFPTGFEAEVGTMWAATEFTEETGATRVVVGSHRWEEEPSEVDPAVTAAAVMSKGSVLLYLGSLYHGGGANTTTDLHRVGINVGYSIGWLRQEENQYLACPPEIARTLPEGLLRLMGYQRGAFALGYVGDMRDPLDWLYDRPSVAKGFSEYRRAARKLLRRAEVYEPPPS
jgi:hypothetical protein